MNRSGATTTLRRSGAALALTVLAGLISLLPDPLGAGRRTGPSELQSFLEAKAARVSRGDGFWLVRYRGEEVLVFAHSGHDRMRIVLPIDSAAELSPEELRTLLEANYDRALDAKYSIHEGRVWAIFAHRLSILQRSEVESALEQVVALKRNYGTSYASTGKAFGTPPN